MNDIWLGDSEKFRQVAEILADVKPLIQLSRHQGLQVTNANDLAPLDPLELRQVRIRDLSAPHNGDLKHGAVPGRLRNSA